MDARVAFVNTEDRLIVPDCQAMKVVGGALVAGPRASWTSVVTTPEPLGSAAVQLIGIDELEAKAAVGVDIAAFGAVVSRRTEVWLR